jgi:hypothetical protein
MERPPISDTNSPSPCPYLTFSHTIRNKLDYPLTGAADFFPAITRFFPAITQVGD